MRPVLALAALATALAAQAAKPDGKLLFTTHCALCHGIAGKGDGLLKTVPPPRDLTSGRFSFGNTRDAIRKTIANGIPPAMPPHKDLLPEAAREALLEYVLTLLPEQLELPERLSRVDAGERPVVVYGALPEHPRALVVGLPGGFTWLYSRDPLRLLEVRRGDCVDRSDWRERGGTPLVPLGKPWRAFGHAESCELVATEVLGREVRITGRVHGETGQVLADLVERPAVLGSSRGIVRRFALTPRVAGSHLRIDVCANAPSGAWVVTPRLDGFFARKTADGIEAVRILAPANAILVPTPRAAVLRLTLDQPQELTLVYAQVGEWNAEVEQGLAAEVAR